jgi:Dipeptidyl aminopeptidases/acylaminoacyl-peptidases
MVRKNWIATFVAVITWAVASAAAPLETYGKLPTLTDLVISPDGTALAYVRTVDLRRVVMAQSLVNGQMLGMINVTDTKLRNLQWADNHTLIITTSVTAMPMDIEGPKREYYLAQSFDVVTKKRSALLDNFPSLKRDMQVMNVVAGVPEPRIIDGRTVVFVKGIYFASNVGHLALFRIDLATNDARMISHEMDKHGEHWVVDANGTIVAESSYYEKEKRWKLDIFPEGFRVPAMDVPASINWPTLEGLSEDGTAAIVSLPGDEGQTIYKQIALKDGTSGPWARADLGFDGVITSRSTGRAIGGMRLSEKSDYVFFDPHADKMWRSINATFKDAADVDLASWSDDQTMVLVHIFGPGYGEGYFFVDMKQHKANVFGPSYSGIDTVAPRRWIEYKAADGGVLHAYLTLPPGKPEKNLPLIVMPHGGPHARDLPGFDWFSQALASRGYVVLQPQFRGSDGFGDEFLHAGFGEFGRKMQTDLSDGVRTLAAQGLIDPKRVCIVGASYGGYAALAGATLDTGVYRCAVAIAGISDLRSMLLYDRDWSDDAHSRGDRLWDRFLGITDLDDPKLNDISPIKHIDRVTIPILLIHGRDDTVVPYAQSSDMAAALKAAKKPYEFTVLKHEDHWLSNSETRLQMLEATVKFLETNNPPDPPAAVAAAK